MTAAVGSVDQRAALGGDVAGAVADVANWRFLAAGRSYGDLFALPSALQHFWSLSIEEQFYLVFPLVVLGATVVGRRRAGLTVVLAGLLAASLWSTAHHAGDADRVYYGTDTRAAELLVGCLLAVALARRDRLGAVTGPIATRVAAWAGGAALVVTVASWALVDQADPAVARGLLAAYGLVSVALVAGALVPGPVATVLSVRPLRWAGQVSFGAYVYHWPLFLLLDPTRTGLDGLALATVRMASTFALAALSATYLERPVREQRAPRLLRRPVFRRPVFRLPVFRLPVLGTMVVVVVLVAGVAVASWAPARLDYADTEALFAGELARLDRAHEPSGVGTTSTSARPLAEAAPPWVAVFGDYSAINMANSLLLRPPQTTSPSYSDGVLARSCSLLRGALIRGLEGGLEGGPVDGGRGEDRCERRAETWPQVRAVTGADVALVAIGLQDVNDVDIDGDGRWEALGDPDVDRRVAAELDQVLESLAADDAVVVLATLPTDGAVMGQERPWLLDPAVHTARAGRLNDLIRQAVGRHPGSTVLDTDRWFAEQGGGAAFRPDGVTADPARWAAMGDWLVSSLNAIHHQATARPPTTGSARTPGPPRVLVVGDSTALAIAVGLQGHAAATGRIEIASVARSSCGLAHGGIRRDRWVEAVDDCTDHLAATADAVARFQPDVVLVVDSLWEVNDRKIPGDDTWRSIGDPVYDRFLRDRMERTFDVLTAGGARLAVVLYPQLALGQGDPSPPERPYPVNDPERMERYHQLLVSIVAGRPGAATIDVAAWSATRPGGELDARDRPDGVHFTVESARRLADEWLVDQLRALAR